MTAGFLGFIISKCLVGFGVAPFNSIFINFLDPFFIGLYLSLIFAVFGSKVSPVTAEESAYRDSLLVLPKEERVAREYQIDRRYGWLLIGMGVATTLFLLFTWALPYNGLI